MPTRPCQLEQPEFGVHRLHQVVRRDRFAGQLAPDLLDQMHERLQRQLGVGKDVGVAGDALIGLHIDQDQRAHIDHAERVLHGTLESARRRHAP